MLENHFCANIRLPSYSIKISNPFDLHFHIYKILTSDLHGVIVSCDLQLPSPT